MKKFLYILFIPLLFSCAEQARKEPSVAIVSGKIIKPVSDRVMIRDMNAGMEAILDSTGSFRLELETEKPGFYLFSHGSDVAHMYLSPGDELFMHIETTSFPETLNYSGKGAGPNNYLAGKQVINKRITKAPETSYMMNEQEFTEYIDTVLEANLAHLEEFFAKDKKKHREFIAAEKARIKYDRASILIAYPSYHRHYSQEKDYMPSEGYYDFLEEIELNDAAMLELQEFRSFAELYVNHKAQERLAGDRTLLQYEHPFHVSAFEVIGEKVYQPAVRTFLYQEYLLDLLNMEPVSESDRLVRTFYGECKDSLAIKKVEEAMKSWEGLHRGMPAPSFSYPDINGDTVSLKDFLGKHVYVDVWATWCRPCIVEIPYLDELQEDFGDKGIVFVSVSVDADKNAWETMVKEENLGGLQLYASNKGQDNIIKKYNIRSIPRFILIDKKGNIVDVSAPKPSGAIREALSALEGT